MRLALPASAKLRMPRREPKPKESGRGRERGAERTARKRVSLNNWRAVAACDALTWYAAAGDRTNRL
jgi:hypothetical protein